MPDLKRMQSDAHRLIVRWGGGVKKGVLTRSGVTRRCTIARQEYKPTERALYLDGSTRFAVSAFDLTIAPDHEQDVVTFNKQLFNIIQPVSYIDPVGGIPIFYQLICMYKGPAV